MRNATRFLIIALLAAATAAAAHQGVQNPAVKARMDAMAEIGAATKTLGQMVKGVQAFDAGLAQAAAAIIAAKAAEAPDLFRAEEDDPLSEALPAIWTSFDDFATKADDLRNVAATAAGGIETPDDLADALARIGAACKACHSAYRE